MWYVVTAAISVPAGMAFGYAVIMAVWLYYKGRD